jgi:uncharacterized membrane protein YkvA (DUF1232 family)
MSSVVKWKSGEALLDSGLPRTRLRSAGLGGGTSSAMAGGKAGKHVSSDSTSRSRTGSKRGGRGGRGRSGAVRRLFAVLAFLPIAGRAPLYARLLWTLLVDARTPASRKAMLAGAVGYVLLGRDIVPDEIPILGSLDDLVVVALAIDVFFSGIDDETLDRKLSEIGISRAAYDEDVARVRRLLPGPVRRIGRRIPGALGMAGDAIRQTGFGPRLRAWLDREGGIA